MWKLRFEVIEGEYQGRLIFDNMVFSEAAYKRLKLICQSLGLDVSRTLNLTPELVTGRTCCVTATTEGYTDDEGRPRTRNTVPFTGYEPIDRPVDKTPKEEAPPF